MRTTTLAACALCVGAAAAQAMATPKNLIFFGNSFTGSGGGVHLRVADIATAAGHETPYVWGLVVGGQTLEWHLAVGTGFIESQIPPGETWDAVVMQEHSTRTTSHPVDGNIPAFLAAAEGLYRAVLDHNPQAEAVLFETWARAPGNDVYPTYWENPAQMQAEVRASYELARQQLNGIGTATVAPIGGAFEYAGFDTSLYAGDLYHASNRGALMMSLVMYGTIYGDRTTSDIDLSGVADTLGLNTDDVTYATTIADAILAPTPGSAALIIAPLVWTTRRKR